jgi:hypothetical protein
MCGLLSGLYQIRQIGYKCNIFYKSLDLASGLQHYRRRRPKLARGINDDAAGVGFSLQWRQILRCLSRPTANGGTKHVSLGTFDDRNHASASVKVWLSGQEPSAYSVRNLKRLAREIVEGDRDGVDHLEIKWRETSYGMVRGIVEFAAEEVERLIHAHKDHRSLRMAVAALREALGLLPGNAATAVDRVSVAVEQVSLAGLPAEAVDRCLAALYAAESLLGMGARTVPVAA